MKHYTLIFIQLKTSTLNKNKNNFGANFFLKCLKYRSTKRHKKNTWTDKLAIEHMFKSHKKRKYDKKKKPLKNTLNSHIYTPVFD